MQKRVLRLTGGVSSRRDVSGERWCKPLISDLHPVHVEADRLRDFAQRSRDFAQKCFSF